MNKIVAKLPKMLAGEQLEHALEIYPEYQDEIREENEAVRLMALSDLYNVFIPNEMCKEIYSKLYLSLLRSLQKKETKLAIQQSYENYKNVKEKEYSSIIGGSDSFTIIGTSGIGKSSAISRAIHLITENQVLEFENPYMKILPCVIVQCPFDSSVKGLLIEILRIVDERLGTNYYKNALRARATTDMLIGSVSQVALNHIGLLVVDEIQHVVNHKNGKSLIGCITQLINNSGISICMVGTPESSVFFSQAMQLARRSIGLQYHAMEYGEAYCRFCEIIFRYQYVRNKSELDTGILQWLYEHSNGNLSIVVALIHDAQEMAILNGREILDLASLEEAYKKRAALLHGFIVPKKKASTSNVRKKEKTFQEMDKIACLETEKDSLVSLITQAKKEERNIVQFLSPYITIEKVKI